jgi:hypothetical protein
MPKKRHSTVFFDDYSMPDPIEGSDIASDIHHRIFPHVEDSICDILTISRHEAIMLKTMADAYLHFVLHPASDATICKQLKEVRRYVKTLEVSDE